MLYTAVDFALGNHPSDSRVREREASVQGRCCMQEVMPPEHWPQNIITLTFITLLWYRPQNEDERSTHATEDDEAALSL